MDDDRYPRTIATPSSPVAAPPAARGGGVQGHIDGIGADGWLEGWAVDPAAPHRAVEIRVLDGERLLAIGSADRLRTDVRAAGFGSDHCGFSLALPDDVFDGQPRQLRVVARAAGAPPKPIGSVETAMAPPTTQRPHERGRQPAARPTPPPGRGIQALRGTFVDEALTTALARIDELERSHRAMGAQRDALQAQLRTLGERFGKDLNALAGTALADDAAGYLGSIVRSIGLTRRRDLWLGELSRRGLSGNIFGTMPHDGAAGPLSVLVWGSGGIGDLLYLGTVVRELFLLLGNCQIFVLNENPAVHEVFAGNPYVAGTMFLEGRNLPEFVHTVHTLDIFDLVAEVRYCITYTTPPLSRAPREFVNAASYRGAEWQRYVRYQWPHLNNLFANEVMARGLNKLGLVGLTSLLPIHADSEVDFFIPDWFPDLMPELAGVAFVTIHHGSDKKMSAAGGVQTKNLPTATWNGIAAELAAAGLKVVQLGESHETLVEGVDIDLRGKTSLIETAYVLKMAAVHVDTEGGLVHLARAMNTRSVVAFGPTPVGFFGYPRNDNIAPPVCGNCWWTSNRWATACPRDLPEPECMSGHSAAVLAARARQMIAADRRMTVASVRAVAGADMQAALNAAIGAFAGQGARGAVLLGREADPHLIADLDRPAGECEFYLPSETFGHAHAAFGDARRVMPYAGGTISRNTASLDWAVAIGLDPNLGGFVPTVLELVRCVRPGGAMLLALPPGSAPDTEDLRWTFDLAQSRQLGGKYRIVWPAEVGGFGADAAVADDAGLFVELTDATPAAATGPVLPDAAAAARAVARAASMADPGPAAAGIVVAPALAAAPAAMDPEPDAMAAAPAGAPPPAPAPAPAPTPTPAAAAMTNARRRGKPVGAA